MKKILLLLGFLASLTAFCQSPQAKSDTIILDGVKQVQLNLLGNDSGPSITILQWNIKLSTGWTKFNPTTTTKSIAEFGKILLRPDGTGTFTPLSSYSEGIINYTIINTCNTSSGSVIFKQKPATPVPQPPSSSTTYTLSVASTTSAGVYSSSGVLVRTLWSNVKRPAGTYSVTWDKKDDYGVSVANPSDYKIRVLSHNMSYTWRANIGNNSRIDHGSTHMRGNETPYDGIENAGYIYFAKGPCEGNTAIFKIAKSDPTVMLQIRPSQCGDYDMQTEYVTTDGNLVYWAGYDQWTGWFPTSNTTPPDTNSKVQAIIYATKVSDDKDYTFSSGAAVKPTLAKCQVYSGIGVVLNDKLSRVTGLAVMKSGSYLYSTHLGRSQVKCYNKTSGTLLKTMNIAVSDITISGNTLFGISAGAVKSWTINADGSLSAAGVNITGLYPLNVETSGNLLYVTDYNSSTIKVYNLSGALQFTYGQANGYKTSPAVTYDKFWFEDHMLITKKGFTVPVSDGSFWVSDPGNCRTIHISSSLTYLEQFCYLPMNYNCEASGNRVFASFLEFDAGSGALVNNWCGKLTDNYKLDNQRRHVMANIFVKEGRTFATIPYYPTVGTDQNESQEVVELTSSGLRFTGIRHHMDFTLYVIDANGDRYRRDYTESTSGSVSCYKSLYTGIVNNNPTWAPEQAYATIPVWPKSAIRYSASKPNNLDIVFSGNYKNEGFHMGRTKNGQWVWNVCPSTTRTYTGPFPYSDTFDIGNGVEYAGYGCYTADSLVVWNYYGESWKEDQVNVWKLFHQDGLMLMSMGITGPEAKALAGGNPDAPLQSAGNAFAGNMVSAGGLYYIYHNDESRQGAMHCFTISGANTIRCQVIAVQ
jgi:hypothetical protein